MKVNLDLPTLARIAWIFTLITLLIGILVFGVLVMIGYYKYKTDINKPPISLNIIEPSYPQSGINNNLIQPIQTINIGTNY